MRWSDSETALRFLPKNWSRTTGRLNLAQRYGTRKADESKSKNNQNFYKEMFCYLFFRVVSSTLFLIIHVLNLRKISIPNILGVYRIIFSRSSPCKFGGIHTIIKHPHLSYTRCHWYQKLMSLAD